MKLTPRQLLKCFEVANSLADTVLLNLARSQSGFELGPHDFLHALYQRLLPFLEQDTRLKSILRTKTAEVLVMAPARLLTLQLSGSGAQGTLPQVTDEVSHTYNAQSSEARQQHDDILVFDNLFPDTTWSVDAQVSL